jgi:hypothetical protein
MLRKLDAKNELSLVTYSKLQFLEEPLNSSSIRVSDSAEHVLLYAQSGGTLHVFSSYNLVNVSELQSPHDCEFNGKGFLGALQLYLLRG